MEARERRRLMNVGMEAENAQRVQTESELVAQEKIDRAIAEKRIQDMKNSRDADLMNEVSQAGRIQGQIEGQEQERINMLNSMNTGSEFQGIPFDYNQEIPEVPGLGMGSQTPEGMQQLEGERQNAVMQEANATAEEAMQALSQGMPPEEVDRMINQNIPPEIGNITKQILNQRLTQMANAKQMQGTGSGQVQPQTQRQVSPANAMANQVMTDTMQIMQPQQQEQQPQQQMPMR